MNVNGGSLVFNLAGSVYLETMTSGPHLRGTSYYAAMNSKANIAIAGGVTLTHTGMRRTRSPATEWPSSECRVIPLPR